MHQFADVDNSDANWLVSLMERSDGIQRKLPVADIRPVLAGRMLFCCRPPYPLRVRRSRAILIRISPGSAIHHTWVTDGLVARPYRNDIRIDIHVGKQKSQANVHT